MVSQVLEMRSVSLQPWQIDKTWADIYFPEIERVVREVAGKIISIKPADDKLDREQSTDFVITVDAGEIACRIRRGNVQYRDLTLRHSRPSGMRTETDKIKAGFARWYLYAWIENGGRFAEWIFVDLDKLRETLLIDFAPTVKNQDGTTFKAISIPDLEATGCLVAHCGEKEPDGA